jgi:hypothetical protein
MRKVDHTTEGPNIAGVSLALYLLVSLLSMMAAYEVGKNPEDIRNSVVHSLQAGQTAPNKPGGDDGDQPFLLEAIVPEFWKPSPHFERAPADQFHLACVTRSFNARAPPCSGSPVG